MTIHIKHNITLKNGHEVNLVNINSHLSRILERVDILRDKLISLDKKNQHNLLFDKLYSYLATAYNFINDNSNQGKLLSNILDHTIWGLGRATSMLYQLGDQTTYNALSYAYVDRAKKQDISSRIASLLIDIDILTNITVFDLDMVFEEAK